MRNFTTPTSKALLANLTRFLILGLTMDAMLGCSAAPGQGGTSKSTSGSTVTDAANSGITKLTERPALTVNQVQYFFPAATGNAPAIFEITNLSRYGAYNVASSLNGGAAFIQTSNNCSSDVLLPGEKCRITIDFTNATDLVQLASISVNFSNSDGTISNSLSMALKGPGIPTPTPSLTPSPTPTATPKGTLTIDTASSFQKSRIQCGNVVVNDVCNYGTASQFDGINCFVGTAPFGNAFIYGGLFYYSPQAGNQPCSGADHFDGRNCVFAATNGNSPFIDHNRFYFRPNSRTAMTYKGGECPVGTAFDGVNCTVGIAPRGPAGESHNLYTGKLIYPARPITQTDLTPCEEGRDFDGTGCIYAITPMSWIPFVQNGTNLYLQAKNLSCVQ